MNTFAIATRARLRLGWNDSSTPREGRLRKLKRQADLWYDRWDMTLCVGALAQVPASPETRIILCTDYKVAGDGFGSESEYKLRILSGQLMCLFSGSPGRAKELSSIYRRHLKNTTLVPDPDLIVAELSKPLRDFKLSIADRYVQNKLFISYRELIRKGPKWFGKEQQSKYVADVYKHKIRVDLIIAGFVEGMPVLCEARADDGDLESGHLEWKTGFSLIGTGSYTAEPVLHARKHTQDTPLDQALYNVYEAKKLGEISPFVGERTTIHVLRAPKDGTSQIGVEIVSHNGEKALAELFKQYGPKPMASPPILPVGSLKEVSFQPVQ